MGSPVLYTDSNITLSDLKVLLEENIYKYIHFTINGDYDVNKNIIELSLNHVELKERLILFANFGYFVYVHRGETSSLVHYNEIRNIWMPIKNKEFSINSDGIVYSFEKAASSIDEKILVIFSQMPIEPYSASLYRYFAKNFSSINKYVGNNVSILRIADIGGITGSYYLDTNYMPSNTVNISKLLQNIALDNNISRENVVLYGCSKGGTAALYYGLTNYYKCVVVDPILNDEFYVNQKKDQHLIEGIFPEEKVQVFNDIVKHYLESNKQRVGINIVISQNSEQFHYIMDVVNPLITCATIVNSLNTNIKDHTTVAPNTINMIISMINMELFNINLSKGLFDFI